MSASSVIKDFLRICGFLAIALPALATEQITSRHSWQPMLYKNGVFSRHSAHLTGLHSTAVNIQPQQEVTILLDRDSSLYIKFITPEDAKNIPPNEQYLQALVSESPGLAEKMLITEQQPTLSAYRHDRIVTLKNTTSKATSVRLYQSVTHRLRDFAPLTWSNTGATSALTVSNNKGQRNSFPMTPKDNPPLFLNKGTYWLESVSPGSSVWADGQHELWQPDTLSPPEMKQDLEFDERNPGRIIFAPEQHANNLQPFVFQTFSHAPLMAIPNNFKIIDTQQASYYNAMQPAVIEVTEALPMPLSSLGNSHSRIQNVKKDWLFDSNYEVYSQPAVEKRRNETGLSAQLRHSAMDLFLSIDNKSEASPADRKNRGVSVIDETQLRTLSQWTRPKTLKPNNKTSATVEYAPPEISRYDFDQKEPDLYLSPITLTDLAERLPYLHLDKGSSAWFLRPDDAIVNVLNLQLLNDRVHGEHGLIRLLADGKNVAEFHLLPSSKWQQYRRGNRWKLKLHPIEYASTASHQVVLPANWQELQVETQGQIAPFRLSYAALTLPKLNESQWQSLLHRKTGNGQDGPHKDIVKAHPHWKLFRHYVNVKSLQFAKRDVSKPLQDLILNNKPVSNSLQEMADSELNRFLILQELLRKPDAKRWEYWQALTKSLRDIGWDGYALHLLNHIIRLHTDTEIRHAAVLLNYELLTQSENTEAAISLLSHAYLASETDTPFNQNIAFLLAQELLQQNKPDFALFLLLPLKSNDRIAQLLQRAASRVGLAQWATQQSKKMRPTEPSASSGETQVVNLQSDGMIDLHSVDLDLKQQNYLIKTGSSLQLTTTGPVILSFTARQWRDQEANQHDWLKITFADEERLIPVFASDFRSDKLLHDDAAVGFAHRFTVYIPSAGTVKMQTQFRDLLVNFSDHLSDSQTHIQSEPCYRDNSQRYAFKDAYQKDIRSTFKCLFSVETLTTKEIFDVELPDASNLPENSDTFFQMLYQFERRDSSSQETLIKLNAQLANWPESAIKSRLTRRVNKNAQWLPQNNPVKVKKFVFKEFHTNVPLTPSGIRSRLLYSPHNEKAERLSAESAVRYELEIRAQEQLRVKLQSQQHAFLHEQSAMVNISIDGKTFDVTSMQTGETKYVPLSVKPGKHTLSLNLSDNFGISSVLASLQVKRDDSDEWQDQPQKIRLKLFQADQEAPYQLYIPEPSWLRVDIFGPDGIANSEYVSADEGLFSWFPANDAAAVFRVSKLALTDATSRTEVSAAINTPAPLASPRSPDLYFTYQPATQPLGNDNNNAGYTWGAEFNMRQRRSTLEDTAQTNRLYEVELHSLKSDAQQRYYLGKSLSLRSYENELSDSLHASLEWWDTQWHDNISLHSGATIAAQEGALTGDWGWSARINAALDIKTSWNRRWFNRLTFDSWARVLDSDDITGEYATSVYSQYKLDHRYGLNISDHLRLKVHHDTELWGKIAINSNPLFDEFSIDNLVTQLGARAFYKGLAADIKWQYRRFFVDRDRRRLLKDYRIGVGLDWFAWQQNSHFRIRLGYDRDLSNDENYWSVRFIFNDDSGRGVRDYMPQSLSFSGLRHQQFMLEEHEQ